jgi:GMP synthase (glutamine-hydrolysing)
MSVVILDFGSQYTRLIARRVRDLNAYSIILPADAKLDAIASHHPQALILSGGPACVLDDNAPLPDSRLFELEVPILGICYGMQYLVHRYGGKLQKTSAGEYGHAMLSSLTGTLFSGFDQKPIEVWMSHSDAVIEPPAGWKITAKTKDNPIAAVESPDHRMFGIQFHPEVAHTPEGSKILENFLRAAKVPLDWTAEQTLDQVLTDIRQATKGGERILLAVSGGVDSSTLALALARAKVDHEAVFVDHGLLRAKERSEVENALKPLGVNLFTVDASDRFLQALVGVVDPEAKRKVIGQEFIRVFEEYARRRGPFGLLAQGTLYPDVIESAGSMGAENIKSHHNVGGLPEKLGFKLLEPFRHLFKDEVRQIAALLGLPKNICNRHPFPGPGLAIRIIGEVTPERLAIVRQADHIFTSALREKDLYSKTWQALAVLTPVRSVGVVGDARRYGYILALRAVTSVDGMTADWARLPHEFIELVSSRIISRVPEIGRVVYDVTSKPPATIEWE